MTTNSHVHSHATHVPSDPVSSAASLASVHDALLWRYAAKKYDPSQKLSEAQVEGLLDASRLSASSYGLQPWRFILVEDSAIRAKIREVSWGQSPVTDASHLLVIAAKKNLTEQDVDAYLADIAKTRGVPVESLKGFRDMMLGTITGRTQEQLQIWNQKQCYIALGTLLAAAAVARVDATPMEGFDPAKVDEILDLDKEGLVSTIIVPLGHRAVDDALAKAKKVRFPLKDVVERR